MNLVSLTNVVVARANLHPEMIYLLAQTIKEEHGHGSIFHKAGDFPTETDPELPMGDEAIDYYKDGPSFLQRYLPFWMINYTKRLIAIVLAIFAVLIPLLTYAPKVYQWFLGAYFSKLYRRLRTVEEKLETKLSAPDIEALQRDLEIMRAARVLPMGQSDLVIDLIMHVRHKHSELASRLHALHLPDKAPTERQLAILK